MTLKHLMIQSRTAVTICFLLTVACIQARIIKGKIIDRVSGEEIIGASVIVKGTANKGTATGLDGSFQLNQQHFPCTLVCSYLGYKTIEVEVNDNDNNLRINLETDDVALGEVVVVAENKGSSEIGARQLERNARNVVNVMSAKAIELSPDLTVANVIQRMSGVTMERNSSGEGQYAILRGMDTRYNYTLFNGMKIPSPDSKNRFVPLEIFHS